MHPRSHLETRSGYAACMADHRTKWDEDNASPVNPGAIVAAGVLIIFLVGLALLFALT
jgi:hypothetical protein